MACLLLFFAGLALDWIGTLHVCFVSLATTCPGAHWWRHLIGAIVTCWVLLVASMYSWKHLLGDASTDAEILCYATGAAIGCGLALWRRRAKE